MGACKELLNGLDLTCSSFVGRYYQSIVLMNRADINEWLIFNSDTSHRIKFNLLAGKSGKLFRSFNAGTLIGATFSKSENKGIPVYTHSLRLPVAGTSEEIKNLIKLIDKSDLFAAIQCTNGDVEIYGFHNGLKTTGYTYDIQSGFGGATINLESRYEEYVPPYLYESETLGGETDDFDNLFADLLPIINGDFNNDFNDDFDNFMNEPSV